MSNNYLEGYKCQHCGKVPSPFYTVYLTKDGIFYCNQECEKYGELTIAILEKDAHKRAAILWGYISLILLTIVWMYWS